MKIRTWDEGTELVIRLEESGILKYCDTLIIEMIEPIITIRDIDGDGYQDLLVEFMRAARGAMYISMLYISDPLNNSLRRIDNSYYYPNLAYDDKLEHISSFRFFGGGASICYVEIRADTITPKFKVTREEENCLLEKWTVDHWEEIETITVSPDVIIPEVIALYPKMKIK